MRNIGYLFYKEYFMNVEFGLKDSGVTIQNFGFDLNDLFNIELKDYPESPDVFQNSKDRFKLETTYPGLLIGAGYNHEVGGNENELKLGFFFDHTTGLPCIPGSSVKVMLRDACEKANGDYIKSIMEELADQTRKEKEEIQKLANDFDRTLLTIEENNGTSKFIDAVFNGKKDGQILPLRQRDIFFDAFPIKSLNPGEKFLANDYITPHIDPLRNPKPIQFLKILPRVVFQFSFRLTNEIMDKRLKIALFKQILLDLGIGAKTNVGYGQFTEYTE